MVEGSWCMSIGICHRVLACKNYDMPLFWVHDKEDPWIVVALKIMQNFSIVYLLKDSSSSILALSSSSYFGIQFDMSSRIY